MQIQRVNTYPNYNRKNQVINKSNREPTFGQLRIRMKAFKSLEEELPRERLLILIQRTRQRLFEEAKLIPDMDFEIKPLYDKQNYPYGSVYVSSSAEGKFLEASAIRSLSLDGLEMDWSLYGKDIDNNDALIEDNFVRLVSRSFDFSKGVFERGKARRAREAEGATT